MMEPQVLTIPAAWKQKIQSSDNSPEMWYGYIATVRQQTGVDSSNTGNSGAAHLKTLCHLYQAALTVISLAEHKKNPTLARLMVDYAWCRSETSVPEACVLLRQARANLHRFAIVHVASAQMELNQGNNERCSKLLQKARWISAEPECLVTKALSNLTAGCPDLIDPQDYDLALSPSAYSETSTGVSMTSFDTSTDTLSSMMSRTDTGVAGPASLFETGTNQHPTHNAPRSNVTGPIGCPTPVAPASCSKPPLRNFHSTPDIKQQPYGVAAGDSHANKDSATESRARKCLDIAPDVTDIAKADNTTGRLSDLISPPPQRPVFLTDAIDWENLLSAKKAPRPPTQQPRRRPLQDLATPRPSNAEDPPTIDTLIDLKSRSAVKTTNPSQLIPATTRLPSTCTKQLSLSSRKPLRSSKLSDTLAPLRVKPSERNKYLSADNSPKAMKALGEEDILGGSVKCDNPASKHLKEKSNHCLAYKPQISKEFSREDDKRPKEGSSANVQEGAYKSKVSSGKELESVERPVMEKSKEHAHDVNLGSVKEPSMQCKKELNAAKERMKDCASKPMKEHVTDVPGKNNRPEQSVIPQESAKGHIKESVQGPAKLTTMPPDNKTVKLAWDQQVPASNSFKTLVVNNRLYYILCLRGRGGSSKVYQGIDVETKQVVAIKVVDLSQADELSVQSYMNEVKFLERLQYSDGVIRLYNHEFNADTNTLLIVMEYGSTDLASILKKARHTNKMSDNTLRHYWESLLVAVKVIHSEGIIHTDLKPANFLLVNEKLKLIDFGIAKAVLPDMTSVVLENTMGTLSYLSPEAISCVTGPGQQVAKVGTKSDVWSLGCILYNMVYGNTPFANIPNQSLKVHALLNPQFPIEYPPLPDADLLDVIKKCLTHNPKDRPSIDDLLGHPYLTRTHKNSGGPDMSRLMEKIALASPTTRECIQGMLEKIPDKKSV